MNTGKQIIYLSLTAFILHVIWENAQASLFQGYVSFSQHFSVCIIGTMGDVGITLFIYFIVALLKNDFDWIATLNRKDVAALAVVGFFIAVGIEQRALLFAEWAYADTMPVIPYLKVGLTPIIQMTFLLPISVYLTKRFFIFCPEYPAASRGDEWKQKINPAKGGIKLPHTALLAVR